MNAGNAGRASRLRHSGMLILASQSPTRAALLHAAGIAFEARPAAIDEDAVKRAAYADGSGPGDAALRLASLKARRVREPGATVIGADQILVCEGDWFDKAVVLDCARAHLLALRGRTHTLMTAVVCVRDGVEIWRHLAQPTLRMRAFSDMVLDDYLAQEGASVLGSVGAYRKSRAGASNCSIGQRANTALSWACRFCRCWDSCDRRACCRSDHSSSRYRTTALVVMRGWVMSGVNAGAVPCSIPSTA